MIGLEHPEVANWFEPAGNGAWRCKQTGFTIKGPMLNFYRSFGGNGLYGLTYLGLPVTEEGLPALAGAPLIGVGVTVQKFERATVACDPQHILDNPPGSGPVYLLHATFKYPL
ncbi:MAG TPA: hypothetical protein VKT82_28800 [Ktedonobacterales bacterium]|nr:hypothetical protein [Ktedonobacterales bacterium]